MSRGKGDEFIHIWFDRLNASLHRRDSITLATKTHSASHYRTELLEGNISSSAAVHACEITTEYEDLVRLQLCDELWSECRAFNAIEGSVHCMCCHGSVIVGFLPLTAFLDGALVAATVELDSVPVQDTENARPALESAHTPDVIHGNAGVVHVHDGFLPVCPESVLHEVQFPFPLHEHPVLGTADGCRLGRKAAYRLQDIRLCGVGEEDVTGVYRVMDAYDPDADLIAEVKECSEFPDAAQRIAEFAHNDGVS